MDRFYTFVLYMYKGGVSCRQKIFCGLAYCLFAVAFVSLLKLMFVTGICIDFKFLCGN